MCAQYTIKISPQQLAEVIGTSVHPQAFSEGLRLLPMKLAPVIVHSRQKGVMITPMTYSLLPSWSKESQPKFATYNARLETLHEKPTWRGPLDSKHCLVPLTGFFESVYEGPLAGHIIEFSQPKNELLFAAGLYDIWVHPESQKRHFSFAIITTEPNAFILENGHDRSPLFLDLQRGREWLTLKGSPQEHLQFLKQNHQSCELQVSADRPLKPGWESRLAKN